MSINFDNVLYTLYAQIYGGLSNFFFNVPHIGVGGKFNCAAGQSLGPFNGEKA